MSKETGFTRHRSPVDGTLFRKETVDEIRRSERLMKVAHQRAKNIINDACNDAQRIEKAAYDDGFSAGALAFITTVAECLINTDTLKKQLMEQIATELQALIHNVFDDPAVITAYACAWAEKQNHSENVLKISLPPSKIHLEKTLYSSLSALIGREVLVSINAHSKLMLSCGDQIVTFDVDHLSEHMVREYVLNSGVMDFPLKALSQDFKNKFHNFSV